MTRRIPFLLLALLASCVAHEAAGDRAAAAGDWRRAVAEYRKALQDDPNTPGTADKLRSATDAAAKQAFDLANACMAKRDFSCAVGEADAFLNYRPGDPEGQLLRASAGRELALQYADTIVPSARNGAYADAASRYDEARRISNDPEVLSRTDAAAAETVVVARAEARSLTASQDFDGAANVLQAVLRFDASIRNDLDALREIRDRWALAEYEKRATVGDAEFTAHRFANAAQAYEEAERIRPGGRLAPALQYFRALARGEAAVARRDWADADTAYRWAAASGQDRTGIAAIELSKVELRGYRITIGQLLVTPVRPNGLPWAGYQSPLLSQLLALAGANAVDAQGNLAPAVLYALQQVPAQNLPDVTIQLRLPDGALLGTGTAHALFMNFGADFVVRTNAYENATIAFWVRHVGAAPEDVASFEIPVADLVSQPARSIRQQGVLSLTMSVTRDDTRPAGPVSGFQLLAPGTVVTAPPPGSVPPPPPPPAPRGTFRVALASVSVRVDDSDIVQPARGRARPDPWVELVINGQVAYRSPIAHDDARIRWETPGIFLDLTPGDVVDVVLHDADRGAADVVASARSVVTNVRPSVFELRTVRGTSVEVIVR